MKRKKNRNVVSNGHASHPTEFDVVKALLSAMKAHNINPVDPGVIRASEQFIRFRVPEDAGKDSSGYCRLVLGKYPIAFVGIHRTGKKLTWRYRSGPKVSHSARASSRQQLRQLYREARALNQAQAKAAKKALLICKNAEKAPDTHRYLKEKGVRSHGLRLKDGALLIPLRTIKNKVQSYQTIGRDGTKLFMAGGRKQGCFFRLGGPVTHRVFISEGYATAATAYELTGVPTFMACDAGNLRAVAVEVRAKYPLADICILGDDDWEKVSKVGYNVGLTKASEAAHAVNGRIAIPLFKQRVSGASDFNDLHRLSGKKAVLKSIAMARTVPPKNGKEAFALGVDEFLCLPVAPREIIVHPWLQKGGLALVHGSSGVGKTHLRDGLAVHARLGVDFLCWKIPRPLSVFIADGEMPTSDVQARMDTALIGHDEKSAAPLRILANDQVTDGPIDLRDPKWQELIEREAAGSEIILLDNVATLAGDTADFNDANSWTSIQRWMTKMRAKGHAVIWFHHDNRAGTQLGTVTRQIVLDASIQLSPLSAGKANGSAFKIKYSKSRWFYGEDKRPFSVVIENDPSDGSLIWTWQRVKTSEEKTAQEGKLKAKVVTLHKSGKSIRKIAEVTKVSKSTIGRWIEQSTATAAKN